MQFPPLRPEQEDELLAVWRFEELNVLDVIALQAELEAAQRAGFPNERQRDRHFDRHGDSLRVAVADAYGALAAEIQKNPERVFSAYKPKGTQGTILRWVFTRGNVLVVVGVFGTEAFVMTCHRAKIDRLDEGFASLDDYLKERDDGKRMVELEL